MNKDLIFVRMFVENRIITIEKRFDLLRRVQHDRIHVDVPVLRIVHRVVQPLVLAGDHSTRLQLHAGSQLGVDRVELVIDKQIHLGDQQLRSLLDHRWRRDRMDGERRRQRVHLLEQTQQAALFQQRVQLDVSRLAAPAYLLTNDRIRVEVALLAEVVVEVHAERVLTHHTLQLLDDVHQRHVKLRRVQNLEVIARVLHERHQRGLHERVEQLRLPIDLHRGVVESTPHVWKQTKHIETLPQQQQQLRENGVLPAVVSVFRRNAVPRGDERIANEGREFEIVFHAHDKEICDACPQSLLDGQKRGSQRAVFANDVRDGVIVEREDLQRLKQLHNVRILLEIGVQILLHELIRAAENHVHAAIHKVALRRLLRFARQQRADSRALFVHIFVQPREQIRHHLVRVFLAPILAPLRQILRKKARQQVAPVVHEVGEAVVKVRFFLAKRPKAAAKAKKAAVPFVQVVVLVARVVALRLAPSEQPMERVLFQGGDGFQQLHGSRHHAVGILHQRRAARFDFGGSLENDEKLVGAILENGALLQNCLFFRRERIFV